MAAAVFRLAVLVLGCAACTTTMAGGPFEGTHWRIAAISGRTAPNDGNYYAQFEGGQISGRFGCNNWGGSYEVTGETITVSQGRSTLMACIEPAASFETQGMAVINRPMQWKLIAGQQLTLSNSAGNIVLERKP